MSEPQHAFHELEIVGSEPDTDQATRIELAVPPALAEVFRFKPGQHLTIRSEKDGAEMRRTYSICSGPGEQSLTLTIKRVAGGWFSNRANDTVAVGQRLAVLPPSGRFTLPPPGTTPRTVLAVAAGSGITPIMSMLRHLLLGEPASRFVLIYGNRHAGSILFRDALADLKDRHPGRLAVLNVLSHGEEGEASLLSGRIDEAKIKALVPRLAAIEAIDHAFLCGPDTLIKTTMQALQSLGLPRERIHFEFFVRGREARPAEGALASAPVVPTAVAEGSQVVIILDGRRRTIEARAGEAVVDAALRAGVGVPYSCKGGMCCTCRARLVEGEAEMRQNYSLEPWEIERGFVLTCQAVPSSRRVVVDYDQV
jgi:ring-1,2-phenylacetyl-CoA epoxidase subunit PaaE